MSENAGHRRPGRRQVLDLVSGAGAAALVFGAVPAVLVVVVGVPVARHPSGPTTLVALYQLLDALAWLAWTACCWSMATSVRSRVHRRDTTAPAGSRLAERLSARIAAAVLVVCAVGPPLASTAGAVAGRPPSIERSETVSPGPSAPLANGRSPVLGWHAVDAGETLSSIAERHAGDAGAWPSIAALNLGRRMDDQAHFGDPAHVRPGWLLRVPGPNQEVRPSGGRLAASPRSRRAGDTRHAGAHAGRPRPSAGGSSLPELIVLGMGSITAAALSRRARRRLADRDRDEADGRGEALSEAAVDVATLVHPFARVPALVWLEHANRLLATAMVEDGSSPADPPVAAVRVGPEGVDLWLSSPQDWTPRGFESCREQTVWHLPSAEHPSSVSASPGPVSLPVLLPVGDDDDGSWFVPVPPGGRLPVLGAGAPSMIAAMMAAAGSWSWADQLEITDDPVRAARLSEHPNAPGSPIVLFVGDPTVLAASAGSCRVVTTVALGAAELTVLVDDRAVTLHPLGVTLRPRAASAGLIAAVHELLGDAPAPLAAAAGAQVGLAHAAESLPDLSPPLAGSPGAAPPGVGAPPGSRRRRDVMTAGPVDVRLLVSVPRIDGLSVDLDSKRARRATELVAYLALHRPDPVTSDRLRTRVLGSGDSDAAAKTLFNTVGAARRALGRDDEGQPYLPPAARSGHYRLSDQVTVDVTRALALARAGGQQSDDDPELATALLRAALELVEGEPLGGLLAGYGWWQAEGHEARLATALVDATTTLVHLALPRGRFALGAWAVERARLLDPYSETLAHAGLAVAAATGDTDRLRREWADHRRRVEEMDPGGRPAERTTRFYEELTRRLARTGAPLAVAGGAQASLAAIEEAPCSTWPSAPAAL